MSPTHAQQIAWMAIKMMRTCGKHRTHDGQPIRVTPESRETYEPLAFFFSSFFSLLSIKSHRERVEEHTYMYIHLYMYTNRCTLYMDQRWNKIEPIMSGLYIHIRSHLLYKLYLHEWFGKRIPYSTNVEFRVKVL